MALGKRREERQQEMWLAATSLPKSQGHVFYRKLNQLLAEADFDRIVERMCEPHYHGHFGRPSIPPGVYFRMLLVGYFEGIGSQRGIAWRCGHSLSPREFLGTPLSEDTPDHSSLTRVRDRLPLALHEAVFQWVLKLVADKELLKGKTVAVDSTMLEADAAMKSIVRRDMGEDWNDYLRRLFKEQEGVENPTAEDLRRFDRQRKDKRVSNEEWVSPTDSDSRIAKMKDGRTYMAYKAEHVLDLETEVVLAASIRHADAADSQTMVDSVREAQTHLREAGMEVKIEEVVCDKGCHATDTIELAESVGLRTYIPERKARGTRKWRRVPAEKRRAALCNRRRVRGARSKRLQRRRSELVERSFAHIWDLGYGRRAAKLVVWNREGPKALPDGRGGLESGVAYAQAGRDGYRACLAGLRGPCVCCVICLVSHLQAFAPLVSPSAVTSRQRAVIRDRRPIVNRTDRFGPISTGC